MKIKGLSFGQMVDQGKSKEDVMKLRGMTSAEYDKALASLMKIREDAAKGLLLAQEKKKYKGTGISKKWDRR